MPRKSRIDAAGALHHVMVRGIERGEVFRNDTDRNHFLERLGGIVQDTKIICYAWALIPNHFHLLLRTGPVSISTVMRRLLTGYALWYNRKYRRHGHVFQNRFKSIWCQEDAYLLELVRYIHLNPLRARLVENIDELGKYLFHLSAIPLLVDRRLQRKKGSFCWKLKNLTASLLFSQEKFGRCFFQLVFANPCFHDDGKKPPRVKHPLCVKKAPE